MTKPQDIDWTARAATLRCDGRWLLDGQRRTAEAHFDKHSPDRRPPARRRGARSGRRGAGRRAQRSRRLRRRPLGAAAPRPAQAGAAALGRVAAGRARGARAARMPGHGQAGAQCLAGRRARCRPLPAVDRRGHRQGVRRAGPHRTRRAGAGAARADGRGGRHRALELPAPDGHVEARTGARLRQQRGAQAQREVALQRAAPGRAGA
jgi:hypothetical protein